MAAVGKRSEQGRLATALVVFLLVAVPSFAQSTSGTTASGLFYEVSGAGEPVVLIHAFSVDRRMWQPQIAALEKRYRVIRYDLRGHGRSAAPSGPYTGFGDLADVLDALSVRRATLVGLSAGSDVALTFALVNPERVVRLVLASPGLGGYRLPPLPWASATFQAAAEGNPERAATLWADTPIMAIRKNEDERERLRSLVADNWRLWTYRRTEQPLTPPPVNRLGEIKSPVLVVTGEQDLSYIGDIAAVIANGVMNGKHVVVPGAGHFVNLDAPADFTERLLSALSQ